MILTGVFVSRVNYVTADDESFFVDIDTPMADEMTSSRALTRARSMTTR